MSVKLTCIVTSERAVVHSVAVEEPEVAQLHVDVWCQGDGSHEVEFVSYVALSRSRDKRGTGDVVDEVGVAREIEPVPCGGEREFLMGFHRRLDTVVKQVLTGEVVPI